MKRILLALLLVLGAGPLLAGEEGPNAGITLYTITPEGVLLLVADHAAVPQGPDRGWASFGGTHEPGETSIQTAARETEEETHGYFKRADLEKALAGQKPAVDGTFDMYFLEVPRVEIADILNTPIPEAHDYHERGPYAWIPLAEIEPHLVSDEATKGHPKIDAKYLPAERQTDWFWSVWLNNLRIAKTSGNAGWQKIEAAATVVETK